MQKHSGTSSKPSRQSPRPQRLQQLRFWKSHLQILLWRKQMNNSEVRNVYEEIKREMRSQDPVLASVAEEKAAVAQLAAEDREARVSRISSVVRTILEENNAACVAAGLN